jgi:predicted ATPase
MELELQISNFKSIQSTLLKLKTGLNILVGPNGSGKTCVCSALSFLHDLLTKGVAQAVAHAGGPRRVYNHGQQQIRFQIIHDYGERLYRRRRCPCFFDWQIGISQTGVDNIATIFHEDLSIYARYKGRKAKMFGLSVERRKDKPPQLRTYICEPREFGRDLLSFWKHHYESENKSKIYVKFKEHLRDFVSYHREAPDKPLLAQAALLDASIRSIVRLLRGVNEYNIVPDVGRAPTEQLPFAVMRPDGEGVAQVLHALEQRDYYKLQVGPYDVIGEIPFFYLRRYTERYSKIHPMHFYRPFYLSERRMEEPSEDTVKTALDNIQRELSAAVKPIASVTTTIDQTTGKRFLVFKSDKDEFYPEEVSDGTVKWLCILVSIYVPYTFLYILEEPENFLHPWMQQRLVTTMREQSKKNDTIFLLTSHSSTVLNAAQPSEILVVTPSENGTQVYEIPNRGEIEQVLKESDFRLGDLWVSGAISGVPSYE